MNRPKYKELYLKEKERADFQAKRCAEFEKLLSETRATGLAISRSRADIRADYSTLHQRAIAFLEHVKQDILSPASEKGGWLYLAALDPENAQAFLAKFAKFSSHVNDKKPPPLI